MNRQNNIYHSRSGSLDRKLSEMRKFNFQAFKKMVTNDNQFDDYSEIYTPTDHMKRFVEYSFRNNASSPPSPQTPHSPHPPLPPHRCPSWESRIYEIASSGIKSLTSTPTHSLRVTHKTDSNLSNSFNINCDKTITMIKEYSVPAYVNLKGRASRIRSIPFTDDSTESSDDEDMRITTTTITTGTTSSSDILTHCVNKMKREATMESEVSEDYAIPPDALLSYSMDAIGLTSNNQQVMTPNRFSSLQRPTHQTQCDIFEKSGHLTKLGGRLKTWKKLWFVLKDGILSYYKSQSDVSRNKPKGEIHLAKGCRISSNDSGTFQIITGNKKVYYLTADSIAVLEEWIRILQNVVKRNTSFCVRDNQKATYASWLVKVKHGHSKKCWCALYGRHLVYCKSPDSTPFGHTDLKGAKVEELDNISDSDNEESVKTDHSISDSNVDESYSKYTIVIFQKQCSEPIYLLLASKQELDSWMYHINVVLSGEHSSISSFEHLISRLMRAQTESTIELDALSIWKNPLLLYSKENISEPLTTLPNDYLRSEAIKLFKSIQLFISAPLDSPGIDYHVSLVQNSLQLCLNHSELISELYLQLAKQTTPHLNAKLCGSSGVHQFLLCASQTIFTCDSNISSEKTSPTSINEMIGSLNSIPSYDKLNPSNYVFIQGFQFLSLAVSLFVPHSRTLWYLRQHLRRSADLKTDIGKYAIYCERALERTLKNGGREYRPSRMEVLSIFLRNPYHHSLPHSIPVNFINGSYIVVGFDGSSTIQEFCQSINSEAGIRENCYSGFALYSDDPIDNCGEHLLDCDSKLADIISKWEMVLREKHHGKFENTRVIKLIYKHRLYMKNFIKSETDKERLLFVYEINNEIINAKFPVTEELGLELSALMAQIEFGDFVNITRIQIVLDQVIERFFPFHLRHGISMKSLSHSVRDKWMELRGRSVADCVRIYLNCTRKWPFCGAKLYDVKLSKPMKINDPSNACFGLLNRHFKLWIAVSEDSIALLDYDSFHIIKQYSYKSLITFGGCKDDFMLVVSNKNICFGMETDSGSGSGSCSSRADSFKSERLLFIMPKTKILEITLIIADYINADTTMRTNVSTLVKSDDIGLHHSFSRYPSLKLSSKSMQTKL